MKKIPICFVIVYLLTILTGCGNNSGSTYTPDSLNGSIAMENTSAEKNGTENSYITFTLCVSVNMIQDGATINQNTDKPDITTTTAIRLMLDKAATLC